MSAQLAVLILILAAATAFGLWRRSRDGRLRKARRSADDPADGQRLTAALLGSPLGERATLVQFSTAFCQPCRATRRILDEVAGMVDGTVHVEIDAESRLDLVRRLDIRRTPTTLICDANGLIIKRAVGLPRKADVIAGLGEVIEP